MQGIYPIYVPDSTVFAEKLVQLAHLATLGVSLTMAKVREQLWIPRLRRLVKKLIKQCYGCKRFQAIAVAAPPPGLLPLERMEHSGVFKVVGVDFTGPIKYRKSPRMERKSLPGTVRLQPDKSLTSGSLAKPGNCNLPRKLKALDCSPRTPFHYILRQWTNLYRSSTLA